jgi:hypothetical protein
VFRPAGSEHVFRSPAAGRVFGRRPLEGEEEAAWSAPSNDRWRGSPSRWRICEEFLAHCEARNLRGKTVEWYDGRTRRFVDWWATEGIKSPSGLRWSDLERFVLHCRGQGFAPNTVHGYAQVLKTLCRLRHRLGYRLGYSREDITGYFEMSRVPATIIPTHRLPDRAPCRSDGRWEPTAPGCGPTSSCDVQLGAQ